MSSTLPSHSPFIDGCWTTAAARDQRDVLNPVTGEPCATFVCTTPEDASEAAQAASRAFDIWSHAQAGERAGVLTDIAEQVRSASEAIAPAITREMGKPLREAQTELEGVAACFEYFAGVCETLDKDTVDIDTCIQRVVRHRPVGPVLIANTWNFPVETVATHLAPALAAGCTAVVLGNETAPGSVTALFKAICSIELPNGAINLVLGDALALANQLLADRAIRHVSYTGSVQVGRILASQAGQNLKRATLELGGNAPAIILSGSDVEATALAIAGKRFWNAGQVCTAPNRIYVHASLYDEFVDAIAAYASGLRIGDGMSPDTDVGPLANARRVSAMAAIVTDAKHVGADIVLDAADAPRQGFFYDPVVLSNIPDDALGMREEVFGPVACMAKFDDTDQVIDRSNACNLGLSGYVFGPDLDEARSLASRLEIGSVGINQMVTAFIDTPFGGIKDSGLGYVGGIGAVNEYRFPRTAALAQ